jgi:flagellar basal-body rod modification protein FlgD
MSGSISSLTSSATSLTSAASAGVSAAAATASTSTNALATLSNNFNDFLSLLTTQLKNQDPSSPMDSNTFTSELVQFTSVEQQITTNSSLTSLIQATQGSEVIQATSVVGKQVSLNSTQLPLQNGTGSLSFNTNSAEPVSITITNSSGVDVKDVSLTSTAGSNTYTWNGKDNTGSQLADGAYTVAVEGQPVGGSPASVPFTVTGTATGVLNTNGVVTLQAGAVSTAFSNVESVSTSSGN